MLTQNLILRDRYRLDRPLSHHYGRRTWLAFDLQSQRPVVLKLLLVDSSFTWQDHKLLEREADLLQQLDHPAIPKPIDRFDLDGPEGGFVLVQSYIDVPPLANWLQRGRTFGPQELQQLAEGLLKILVYLHSQNPPIIHRDIKPSNILLTGRSGHSVGQVYLVDFGAVQTSPAHGTRTIAGSYGYMPLEQFGGRAAPGSDLYSLGMTLIEIITGIPPANLLDEDHQLPPLALDTHPMLESWLRWLVQPQLSGRPPSAQVALEALQAIAVDVLPVRKGAWVWSEAEHQWQPQTQIYRTRPQGSHLKVEKAPNQISFTLPRHSRTSMAFCTLFFGLFVMTMSAALADLLPTLFLKLEKTGATAAAEIPFFNWIVMLFAWTIGVLVIVAILLNILRLILLERTEICLSKFSSFYNARYRFFRWRWNRTFRYAPLQKIIDIPAHFEQDGMAGRILRERQVCLYLGTQQLVISRKLAPISEPELEWLSQEIGDWLDVPRDCIGR